MVLKVTQHIYTSYYNTVLTELCSLENVNYFIEEISAFNISSIVALLLRSKDSSPRMSKSLLRRLTEITCPSVWICSESIYAPYPQIWASYFRESP